MFLQNVRQATEADAVWAAAKSLTDQAPEGLVTFDGENQHVSKIARIDEEQADPAHDPGDSAAVPGGVIVKVL